MALQEYHGLIKNMIYKQFQHHINNQVRCTFSITFYFLLRYGDRSHFRYTDCVHLTHFKTHLTHTHTHKSNRQGNYQKLFNLTALSHFTYITSNFNFLTKFTHQSYLPIKLLKVVMWHAMPHSSIDTLNLRSKVLFPSSGWRI
jgi:hypothetical protein